MKNLFTKIVFVALMCSFSYQMTGQDCPSIDDMVYPPDLTLSEDGITEDNILDMLTPEELVATFGYTEAEAYVTWDDPDECNNINWSFEDQLFDVGGGSFKILRTWTTLDWLENETSTHVQIVRNIVDLGSYCLSDITLGSDPWGCTTAFLTSWCLVEGFEYENLVSDPAEFTELPLGSTEVSISGTVDGEDFECTTTIFVVDNTPPVAIASESVQINLNPTTCTFEITPEMIDNGSHDGDCGDVTLEVFPTLFTQDDSGQDVNVTLTVTDEVGNVNFTWATVSVNECGTGGSLACIGISTIAPLNDDGIQLYAEDFIASGFSDNLSMVIEDEDGNVIPDAYLPQGSYGGFFYTITDNNTGNTCWGTLNIPLPYAPCTFLVCNSGVHFTLSADGTVMFDASDLANDVADCPDLNVNVLDLDGNILLTGTAPVMTEAGTYFYSVFDTDGNSCWGNLTIDEYAPCPSSIVCNDEIFVSMFSSTGEPATALITSDMVLEGNTTGCDIDSYTIELEYAEVGIDQLVLRMEDAAGFTGTNVCVPMTADNFTDIQSFQGGLSWDPAVLSFTGTENSILPGLAYNDSSIDQGILDFNWFDITGITPLTAPLGGTIFEVCFDVVGTDQESSSIQIINSQNVIIEVSNSNQDVVDAITQSGTFTVGNTPVVGPQYSGTGSVLVTQAGIYTYTITDPVSGNSCWGTLNIVGANETTCPGVADVSFPANIDIAVNELDDDNLYDFVSPENLVGVLGFQYEHANPTWPSVFSCDFLFHSYTDQVLDLGNGSYKIIRTWTVLDWLTAEIATGVQIIQNVVLPGLICDFLPNTAPLGDCDSGHTDEDDVEWPADLLDLADYRIKPSELELYSMVDPSNSQPVFVDNEDQYTTDYIDILNEFQINQLTVSRVWTVTGSAGVDIATYSQTLVIDISDLASLVSVNTMFDRPIPDVELNNTIMTNTQGVGFIEGEEELMLNRADDATNGVTIRDLVLIQQYILGLREFNEYQILASDSDQDNNVSGIDIIQFKKTILEVVPGYNPDWFFIDNTDALISSIEPKANYIGIKPGDVDDDAYLGSASSSENGVMVLSDVLINNGESYEATLEHEGEELSLGVEIHLYYDENLISVDELYVENPDLNIDYNINKPGEIHLTLFRSNGSAGFLFAGENLVNIKFTANSNGLLSDAIDDTYNRNSYLLNLDYELVTLNLEFDNEIDTGVENTTDHNDLFKVFPNPATDIINFDFIDKAPSTFTIQLFDTSGKLISEDRNQTKVNVANLSSGLYLYRLIDGNQLYTGQISVIK